MAKSLMLSMIIVCSMLLAGCGVKNQSKTNDQNKTTETTERVNQYLNTKGIQLPEGSERADLSGDEGTGVAVKEKTEGGWRYTIIADLAETKDKYQAWLQNDKGERKMLGELKLNKGGYIIEATNNEDDQVYKEVMVGKITGQGNESTVILLKGSF